MVTTRTSTVNAMMATPIWEKHSTYNTSKVLSIGRMITSFQMRMNMEKNSTYSCLPPPISIAGFLVAGTLRVVLRVVAPMGHEAGKHLQAPHLAVVGTDVHHFLLGGAPQPNGARI